MSFGHDTADQPWSSKVLAAGGAQRPGGAARLEASRPGLSARRRPGEPQRGGAWAGVAALKMMGEMGLRCGIRRETDYHRYNSYGGCRQDLRERAWP